MQALLDLTHAKCDLGAYENAKLQAEAENKARNLTLVRLHLQHQRANDRGYQFYSEERESRITQ